MLQQWGYSMYTVGAILAKEGEDGTLTLWYMPTELHSSMNITTYGATELEEALEVIWSVKHLKHYMYESQDFYWSQTSQITFE